MVSTATDSTAVPSDGALPSWSQAPDAVQRGLQVSVSAGLTAAEAAARIDAYGRNELASAPPKSKWKLLAEQFTNRLVLVLLVAAVVAYVVGGELKDPIIIAVVVIINALLGFVQESRAESSLAALKRMLVTTARVRRDGHVIEVPAAEIVPGDVVLVSPGDRVPADGRWVAATDLEVDEAAFTGESLPVAKQTEPVAQAAALSERRSMGFMNTTVTRGRGEMVVTATGADTEIGRVAGMLRDADPGKTPLQRQIDRLAMRLTLIAGAAVFAVTIVGLIRRQSFSDTLLQAVALAVAAIPEGLPAVLTVTLAIGTHQMAKRHAIVKRLASVETLGCTTVICTDKTGTLTMNRMTAVACWRDGDAHAIGEAGPPESARALVRAGALCNDARLDDGRVVGDPTEGALLGAAGGFDLPALHERFPRIAEIPFDSAHKFMATFHSDGNDVLAIVKGAPDVVLRRVADADMRRRATDANEAFAGDGLRVLAVATRRIPVADFRSDALDAFASDLQLDGLFGIQDPQRPEARDAIALCRRAGIAVKMITGDHAVTAGVIGRSLGLRGDVVTGADLDQMSDEELTRRVDDIAVFARVAPEHKVRLVNALRARGDVVAMTGDGVNDAPALKSADIGVAMGITGTEVTKEAAAMVLTDDNFATIVDAVRGGRTIYDNITKFVRFQLATNMGAILTILTATLFAIPAGGGVFFTPVALLWVNIIMDGPPALALGVDPPDPDTMRRAPRNANAQILDGRRIRRLVALATVMMVGTIGVYFYAAGQLGEISEIAHARAATMAFTTFVLFQMFNLFNARFDRLSVFGSHTLRNARLWWALAVVAGLQVLAVLWSPLQRLITGDEIAAQLSVLDWLLMLAVASSIIAVSEVLKFIDRRRNPEPVVIDLEP
ncbi:MAG: cation-translocating P-type ATPase [Acidimicrobiia bacterium]